jgi:hypothetical protein
MRFMDANTCTGIVSTSLAVRAAYGLMGFPLADDEIGTASDEQEQRL